MTLLGEAPGMLGFLFAAAWWLFTFVAAESLTYAERPAVYAGALANPTLPRMDAMLTMAQC